MHRDGDARIVVIEWELADGAGDADAETGGAFEFAGGVAPADLPGVLAAATEEARGLLESNGSGWVDVLVGVGESFEDVDVETAEAVFTFEL